MAPQGAPSLCFTDAAASPQARHQARIASARSNFSTAAVPKAAPKGYCAPTGEALGFSHKEVANFAAAALPADSQ